MTPIPPTTEPGEPMTAERLANVQAGFMIAGKLSPKITAELFNEIHRLKDRLGEAESARPRMMQSIWPKDVGNDTVAMDADDPVWNAAQACDASPSPHDELLAELDETQCGHPTCNDTGCELARRAATALRAQIQQTKTWQRISELAEARAAAPEPLARVTTQPLPEGDHISKLIVPGPLPVPPGTEVEVYPAGRAPTGVTREALSAESIDTAIACIEAVIADGREPKSYVERFEAALAELAEFRHPVSQSGESDDG